MENNASWIVVRVFIERRTIGVNTGGSLIERLGPHSAAVSQNLTRRKVMRAGLNFTSPPLPWLMSKALMSKAL